MYCILWKVWQDSSWLCWHQRIQNYFTSRYSSRGKLVWRVYIYIITYMCVFIYIYIGCILYTYFTHANMHYPYIIVWYAYAHNQTLLHYIYLINLAVEEISCPRHCGLHLCSSSSTLRLNLRNPSQKCMYAYVCLSWFGYILTAL